ncbi:MAG: TIGR04282 family arsenosugar biosynthesis glycosyltransferase [Anaerolineaceae bacterium]|nr:TIGR04282 family arsenosugar biosynthesis glycosyltransferase [Anaerolineaceae bacterium]
MRKKTLIMIMAKQPLVGKTKTRMCPPLQLAEAAALFEALLKDTISLVNQLDDVQTGIAISPPGSESYFESISSVNTLLLPVEGADIGECLSKTILMGLEMGFQKVMAINSDGPSLPIDYLSMAVELLDKKDVVFGPGHDGGYYLVGLQTHHKEIFQNIPWSTADVMPATLKKSAGLGLSVGLTPEWYDVDTQADLERLKKDLAKMPAYELLNTRAFLRELDLS